MMNIHTYNIMHTGNIKLIKYTPLTDNPTYCTVQHNTHL